MLEFDIDADLTPIFNWSVKQLFLFITAEYQDASGAMQKVVIWDSIISNDDKADADLYLKNIRAKYHMFDIAGPIAEVPMKLALNWEVTPIAGLFSLHGGPKVFAKDFMIQPTTV